MANFTKKAIQESFLRLLMERPLSQITVKDVVADCGVNRNTFYYYFDDIPKLIETIFTEDAEAIIQAYPAVERIEDCLDGFIEFALAKKRAILHIYNSANRELYEQYLWRVCDHVINSYLNAALKGRKICQSDFEAIRKYLTCVGFGVASGWVATGMTGDIHGTVSRICEIKKGMMEEMISRCEESR